MHAQMQDLRIVVCVCECVCVRVRVCVCAYVCVRAWERMIAVLFTSRRDSNPRHGTKGPLTPVILNNWTTEVLIELTKVLIEFDKYFVSPWD